MYRFVEEAQMYVCDHQTSTGVPDEVMTIQAATDEDNKTWYCAWEGQMLNSRFHGRQIAFRTHERFWEDGTHQWQLNANSSSKNTDNTIWTGQMSAITKVPEGVHMVTAAVDVLPIEDAGIGGAV